MKTTAQWWDEVSNDETKMMEWLKAQYHGEVTAADRIEKLIGMPGCSDKHAALLRCIVEDEREHAEWVKGLLEARGIAAEVLVKDERYWRVVLAEQSSMSFVELCAVGHHAETMRLERIELLAADDRFQDIAEVFSKILVDETFHAKAFGAMSTPEAIEQHRAVHQQGRNALGLVA